MIKWLKNSKMDLNRNTIVKIRNIYNRKQTPDSSTYFLTSCIKINNLENFSTSKNEFAELN